MKPDAEQIAKTLNVASQAKELLSSPATESEIMEQFLLISGGMRLPKDMDNSSAAKAYLFAMSGFSSWAIRQSVASIIKGKAEGFSKTFMPAAPELAEYCEKLEYEIKWRADYIEKAMNAPEEKTVERISDERRAELEKQIFQAGKVA